MPNVNLIAARRSEKKRLERTARHLFLGLTAEAAVLALLGGFLGIQQMSLRTAMTDADARLSQLQPTMDRIAQIERDTAELIPKVETLQQARTDTLRWRAMLQIVSQSVPQSVWLSGITAQTAGADATITIAGVAGSQTLVGETMTRLGSYPVFDRVDLRFTQMSAPQAGVSDSAQRVAFEIGAHLRSTAPAETKPAETAPSAGGETKQVSEGGNHHDNGGA